MQFAGHINVIADGSGGRTAMQFTD